MAPRKKKHSKTRTAIAKEGAVAALTTLSEQSVSQEQADHLIKETHTQGTSLLSRGTQMLLAIPSTVVDRVSGKPCRETHAMEMLRDGSFCDFDRHYLAAVTVTSVLRVVSISILVTHFLGPASVTNVVLREPTLSQTAVKLISMVSLDTRVRDVAKFFPYLSSINLMALLDNITHYSTPLTTSRPTPTLEQFFDGMMQNPFRHAEVLFQMAALILSSIEHTRWLLSRMGLGKTGWTISAGTGWLLGSDDAPTLHIAEYLRRSACRDYYPAALGCDSTQTLVVLARNSAWDRVDEPTEAHLRVTKLRRAEKVLNAEGERPELHDELTRFQVHGGRLADLLAESPNEVAQRALRPGLVIQMGQVWYKHRAFRRDRCKLLHPSHCG